MRSEEPSVLIKAIVITGAEGEVEITRTSTGARVTAGHRVICEIERDEDREHRYAKAVEVAKVVYGRDRRGRVQATNSMTHGVLDEIERVAGC